MFCSTKDLIEGNVLIVIYYTYIDIITEKKINASTVTLVITLPKWQSSLTITFLVNGLFSILNINVQITFLALILH